MIDNATIQIRKLTNDGHILTVIAGTDPRTSQPQNFYIKDEKQMLDMIANAIRGVSKTEPEKPTV